MEKRLLLFLPLAFGIYILSVVLEANRRAANQPPAKPDAVAHRDAGKAPGDKAPGEKNAADKAAGDKKITNAEARIPRRAPRARNRPRKTSRFPINGLRSAPSRRREPPIPMKCWS